MSHTSNPNYFLVGRQRKKLPPAALIAHQIKVAWISFQNDSFPWLPILRVLWAKMLIKQNEENVFFGFKNKKMSTY